MSRMTINDEVAMELVELRKLGLRVSNAALKAAKTDDLSEYEGASVSEIADLLRDLYN